MSQHLQDEKRQQMMHVTRRMACVTVFFLMGLVGLRCYHSNCQPLVTNMALLTVAMGEERPQPPTTPPQFNRDIRPLLSDLCFQCHGPDERQRQGNLRLDQLQDDEAPGEQKEDRARGARRVLTPGKPDQSELWRRIQSTDPEERMPPPQTGRQVTAAQSELIRRWIADGAPWQGHWAYQPIERPPVPADPSPNKNARHPIDRFIRQRLPAVQLTPAPAAEPHELARRVTLDLTGLPATLEQQAEFPGANDVDAYERYVDRLLASPRWGERLAARWLDAARYADTSGYQNDGPRYMWRWRDWVLDACNHDLPFDQFTVEQMAGDLLPSATLQQRIATGFHRNHRGNAEGGIIPEEYAVEYVIDRVDTTGTVWLGLTLGCARCHDHKFDPIAQRDYYSLYAYFNSIPEFGRAIKEGNSPPYLPAPTALQLEQQQQLATLRQDAEREVARWQESLQQQQSAWELRIQQGQLPTQPPLNPHWNRTADLVAHFALDDAGSTGNLIDLTFSPGRIRQALNVSQSRVVELGEIAGFGYTDAFTLAAWIQPTSSQLAEKAAGTSTSANAASNAASSAVSKAASVQPIVSKMTNVAQGDGYCWQLSGGKLQFLLVKRWLDDALRVETRDPIPAGDWQHVAVTYDGSRLASGVRIYVNGQSVPLTVQLDALNQTITTKEPLRIGAGSGSQARFQGLIDDLRIYRAALEGKDVEQLASDMPIPDIIKLAADRRSPAAARKLREYFRHEYASAEIQRAYQQLGQVISQQQTLAESISTVMVMQELPEPKPAHVLIRGEYDKPGEVVGRRVLTQLGAAPMSPLPANRLGLAQWLISPSHPLTARVAVNRWWQMLFGTGLVKTTEDFGSQGEPPSHPELLDWLATELRAPGGDEQAALAWSVKRLVRDLVTSDTYRQSSHLSPAARQIDPENRWLARGPRFRLPAEMIRDQALAASGLLVSRIGGPSVKPYQPADLWKDLATDTNYPQDHGAGLYRRSLYTYWKRTVAPPTMVTFDASGRETCTVRDTRTNTPLQALTLLNETSFVEAARVLAQRVLLEGPESDEQRLQYMFQLLLGRTPRAREQAILLRSLTEHRQRYASDPLAAKKAIAVGEYPVAERLVAAELAAFTTVASLLLNLDELVNKP
ncbi:MAG: DUF1553 domain-containing protein [Planctomycetota bacterium]